MIWYLICLVLVIVLNLCSSAIAFRLGVPVIVSMCVVTGLSLYLAFLVPGAFGFLSGRAGGMFFLGICMLLFFLGFRYFGKLKKRSWEQNGVAVGWFGSSLSPPEVLATLFSLMMLVPMVRQIVQLGKMAFNPNSHLSWDVVSYHLPGFIEFFQNHTLWSMTGEFQSYSFGYELIGNFFSSFFHAHWGITVMHLWTLLFFLAVIAMILRQLLNFLDRKEQTGMTIAFLVAIALWCYLFRKEVSDVGKNDIFLTTCILAAFGLVQEILRMDFKADGLKKFGFILFVAIGATGLSLGTKPTALAYLPVLLLFLGFNLHARRRELPGENARFIVISLSIFLTGALLTGGFFYFRNLVEFGHVTDPKLLHFFRLSLINNLHNPALYVLSDDSMTFLIALITPVLILPLWWFNRTKKLSGHYFLAFFVLYLTSIASFAVTPHAIFHESLDSAHWKLRLGMPLFSLMCILLSVVLVYLFQQMKIHLPEKVFKLVSVEILVLAAIINHFYWSRYPSPIRPAEILQIFLAVTAIVSIGFFWHRLRQKGITQWLIAALALFVLAMGIYLPDYWEQHPAKGLPGYERVGNAKTHVFEWIQQTEKPMRIYSAGLRPYGLYGRNWQNRVCYDLHSKHLEDKKRGKARLAEAVVEFGADMVFISLDPHKYARTKEKPMVKWMRKQTQCFEEIYRDPMVSGFKVLEGCSEKLKPFLKNQT